uniref:Uncharacterized protein n=1 Tax=Aeromonas caviae TaxID=648 RepID=A0A1L0CSK9_AERCA|nr:Uncharacterised protein [Aeromonas caviae]
MFVAVLGVVVGSNGETLQTTQTRSGAPQHSTTAGRYEKTGLAPLGEGQNRESSVRVVVFYRSVQRGGGPSETVG